MPFEFCCIGNNSHFDGVDCDNKSSHFGWVCERSDCDGARVVRSSCDTPMWFDKLVSRQPECGGGPTSPIPRENPNSSGLKSEAWLRGLKNPEAVDGDGQRTPPPYTLSALWVIMLPVLAPQSAGGPTFSRKILEKKLNENVRNFWFYYFWLFLLIFLKENYFSLLLLIFSFHLIFSQINFYQNFSNNFFLLIFTVSHKLHKNCFFFNQSSPLKSLSPCDLFTEYLHRIVRDILKL